MPTLGTLAATEQGKRYGWSPTRGAYSIRTWKGGKTQIEALKSQLALQGWQYEVSESNGLWAIEATTADTSTSSGETPTGLEVTNTWEFMPNKVCKDLLSSNASAIAALTADEIKEIRHYIDNKPDAGQDPKFTNATAQDPVYQLMLAGVEHWEVYQPVLRHTMSVPASMFVSVNYNYIGSILSTATLFRTESVPGDFLVPIRAFTSGAISRTDAVALSWGWKKAMPTLSVTYGTRREVHMEYEWGLWSTLLYGSVL